MTSDCSLWYTNLDRDVIRSACDLELKHCQLDLPPSWQYSIRLRNFDGSAIFPKKMSLTFSRAMFYKYVITWFMLSFGSFRLQFLTNSNIFRSSFPQAPSNKNLSYENSWLYKVSNCHGYQLLSYLVLHTSHMLCVSCTCSVFVQFYCSGVRRDTSIPFILCQLDPEGSQGLLATLHV